MITVTDPPNAQMVEQSEALAHLYSDTYHGKPIRVFGTQAIRDGFDAICIQQALNSRSAPGVNDLVLNPDAHAGYGAPVGCVLASPTHIYPGPVGVDIKCSMSLLQMNVPGDAIADKRIRRDLINAIGERIPTGAGRGQRSAKKSRRVNASIGRDVAIQGASVSVCEALGIPPSWITRCEDAAHLGHDDTMGALSLRLDKLMDTGNFDNFAAKIEQLGSYGGGNHFGEANIVDVSPDPRQQARAHTFGLQHGNVAFLSHCGSRGFGFQLANQQFRTLRAHFEKWNIPLPGGDRELVYAPLGTPEANDYLDDMALGGNFATVNHMLINALVLEAFQELLPGTTGNLVYFISHNITRREIIDGHPTWVHRKGATRAVPAGHHSLAGTEFSHTGHPILLPGNPREGSVVMAAEAGAEASCFSVNHGAGRAMGRKVACRTLDQKQVDAEFAEHDIISNCRQYPLDEAPDAYKNFNEVVRSVELAGLASTVARLKARFVIKDADKQYGGAA